ncbi:protein of unknown function [Tenacibaculum soleae]|uniref:DoxX family membrane protein n=1 Tax=Tenacibaculum soleae TaxID=447689 RepID=UPI003AB7419C
MKQITKNLFNPGAYPNNVSTALLILRVVIGIFMLTHGWEKMETFLAAKQYNSQTQLELVQQHL